MEIRAEVLTLFLLVTGSVGDDRELVDQLMKLPAGQVVRAKRGIATSYDDTHCLANFEQRDKTIIRTKVSSNCIQNGGRPV